MNFSSLLNLRPKEANKSISVFDEPKQQMSAEKLAELIEGITAGKTIQMIWGGSSAGYVDMAKRSLEDYLHVFLQPLDKYTRFRVVPIEVELDSNKSTTPFHQECIDLLKDYNQNKEVLDALNLIKSGIGAAVKNNGYVEHKFHCSFNPWQVGAIARHSALELLAKELPNKYNGMTDIWTFYTSPDTQM